VPQATLQIEAGDTYGTLRGVMLECDVEILRAAVPPHPDRQLGPPQAGGRRPLIILAATIRSDL